jgi:hypothetical protein
VALGQVFSENFGFPCQSTFQMPPSIYQDVVNLVVCLSIRRRPSEFMNVMMWEHLTFDNKIFGYGKVYYSNSIIITNLVQTLIPNCWFGNVLPADFGIEI